MSGILPFERFTVHHDTRGEVYNLDDPTIEITWAFLKSKGIMVQRKNGHPKKILPKLPLLIFLREKSNMFKIIFIPKMPLEPSYNTGDIIVSFLDLELKFLG